MNPTEPTEAQVRELLALEAKATAGPWCRLNVAGYHEIIEAASAGNYDARRLDDESVEPRAKDNIDVACAARNLARPLAESWLRLREECERLRDHQLNHYGKEWREHDDIVRLRNERDCLDAEVRHLQDVEQERDRLAARVAELEAALAAKEKP